MVQDADRPIELALTAAGMMLEGGASAASVAGAMHDIASAAGLGGVTADVNDSVLTIGQQGTAHVGATAISSRTYDFGRLRDTTRVVNDLCANRIDPTTARRLLDTIGDASTHHAMWLRLVASGAAGASWAVVFGADSVVTVSAFVVNIVLAWAHSRLTRIGWPIFFTQLIAGIIAVAVAATVAVFHPHADASLTVTSVIVLLLPGVAFIGGVKDAISGWYLTAIARLAESITAVLGLIIGIQLALTAAAHAGINLDVAPPKAINLSPTPTTLIASGAIAVFFGIVSRNSPKTLAASAVLSAVGLTIYTGALGIDVSGRWATAAAATTIGALAAMIGTLDRTPTLAITTPAMLPLLPGIALYQGMFYGGTHLQNAIMLALALAGGVTAGEYITTTLRSIRVNRPSRA
ncbi:threonine/serine ThrE exporter family protein [Mycolicibacterium moriokaense]|uniref:Uncharacterized membrane protein YjjP (DUF1212 family) n=1 Tax=Mycolicibacterium moriokaense TaxID=39691 RepID=A0A318HJN3_9MYCO|nr:threonine/serine exporter family protein [Mycolicibacterium moriokaense]PXX10332.1 uncharacterized membrane protein YjjP (DUF1212 family) [Mycolicibacterium moriokaense]